MDSPVLAVRPARDVGAALAALSEEDLLRLRAIARLRARSLPDGVSWSDLLHEAVLRALTGENKMLVVSASLRAARTVRQRRA